jgi:hypothetical protein
MYLQRGPPGPDCGNKSTTYRTHTMIERVELLRHAVNLENTGLNRGIVTNYHTMTVELMQVAFEFIRHDIEKVTGGP